VPDDVDDLLTQLARRIAEPPAPLTMPNIPGLEIRTIELDLGFEPQWPTPPPLRPPCDHASVDATEAALHVTLPPLLRRLYTEVGDGGYGPGDGIVGVAELVDLHHSYAVELAVEQELGEWPAGLVPFCELDQTLMACIDCSEPAGPIVTFEVEEIDFDEGTGFDEAFAARSPSLEAWLREWLAG